MDKSLAKYIAVEAYKSGRPLENLLPLLKAHCTEEEYKTYSRSIAKIIHTIGVEVTDKIFVSYPEIKTEIEQDLRKYGMIL